MGREKTDELEEALKEDEIKINVHASGKMRADKGPSSHFAAEEEKTESSKGRGWKFWRKKE